MHWLHTFGPSGPRNEGTQRRISIRNGDTVAEYGAQLSRERTARAGAIVVRAVGTPDRKQDELGGPERRPCLIHTGYLRVPGLIAYKLHAPISKTTFRVFNEGFDIIREFDAHGAPNASAVSC